MVPSTSRACRRGKVLSRWMRLNWMSGGSGSEDPEGFITCGIERSGVKHLTEVLSIYRRLNQADIKPQMPNTTTMAAKNKNQPKPSENSVPRLDRPSQISSITTQIRSVNVIMQSPPFNSIISYMSNGGDSNIVTMKE